MRTLNIINIHIVNVSTKRYFVMQLREKCKQNSFKVKTCTKM